MKTGWPGLSCEREYRVSKHSRRDLFTSQDMDPAYVEAIQQIKFADKDKFQLAEQAKSHGNMLFQYGKKNPHQYHNSIVSYNVSRLLSLVSL